MAVANIESIRHSGNLITSSGTPSGSLPIRGMEVSVIHELDSGGAALDATEYRMVPPSLFPTLVKLAHVGKLVVCSKRSTILWCRRVGVAQGGIGGV